MSSRLNDRFLRGTCDDCPAHFDNVCDVLTDGDL